MPWEGVEAESDRAQWWPKVIFDNLLTLELPADCAQQITHRSFTHHGASTIQTGAHVHFGRSRRSLGPFAYPKYRAPDQDQV
jgi:hypothetical protein